MVYSLLRSALCIMCVQYRRRYAVPWETIMIHVGDILSTVKGAQGYHEYRERVILSTVGDTQYCGDIMMYVGDIMSTMGVLKYQKMYSPTVLNTPHGTQYIPHIYQGTKHPHGTSHTLYGVVSFVLRKLFGGGTPRTTSI